MVVLNTWPLCSILGGCVKYLIVVFNTCWSFSIPEVVFNTFGLCSIPLGLCSLPGACVQYPVGVLNT